MSNPEWEQLMALRGITKVSGGLHSAQVIQLQYWPRLAIPHATTSSFAFSFEKKLVEFKVTLKGKSPKDLPNRLKGLDASVKDLLGPEYTVRVKHGRKKLFESKGLINDSKDSANAS